MTSGNPLLDLPLTYLHRPADLSMDSPSLLVLLHGVGSNEQDMFGLAPAVPARFDVLSLRAPNPLGPDAFAWFTFATAPDGRRVIDSEQEAASRPLVAEAVQAAGRQLSVAPENVVVGGFSQGGIMALSLLLTRPELMRAAMVMHSRLLPEVLPFFAPKDAFRGRQLWVSHGIADAMIPLSKAHDIRDTVEPLPIELTYHEFPGGHEIRLAEQSAAMTWLETL
jgi:phospholipase/carboxylesterase